MFYLSLPLVALWNGISSLFAINTSSLRPVLAPNELLGRIMMTNNTITGSAIPIGLIVGSATIQSSHSVSLVFTVVGIVLVILPIVFSRTALGRADKYMSPSSNV